MNTMPNAVAPTAVASLVDTESSIAASGVPAATAACGGRRIRLLVFTSLYPNATQPRHGVFVEERLRHLIDSGRIDATVVAPVPWFPFRSAMFGDYSRFATVPKEEERYGIRILHPRYPVIPKLGMNISPALMVRALLPTCRRLQGNGADFDLIDAHYLYPDGVAAARIGAALGKPVVISARGSDVTLISRYRSPRRQILRTARQASAIITVSRVLRDKLVELGAAPQKITVLRNGVDLDRFGPRNRTMIRARLGLSGPVWLTVGHLIELKGVHIVIEALAQVPDATLLIAGDGPEGRRMTELAKQLGLQARIRFLGAVPHGELCNYYNAADALMHASSREGMPNAVLESMACGTPVVAAPFEGVRELLDTPEAGEVASERTCDAIVAAWLRLRDRAPTRAATRAHAERFGWQPVVKAQCALYTRVLSQTAEETGP